MPYILPENRPKYDPSVNKLFQYDLMKDEIIYILFEYCNRYIKPSYNNYKNYCGELNQCAREIERRIEAKEISIVGVDADYDIPTFRKIICDEKVDFLGLAGIQVNGDLNYILYAYCIRHIFVPHYSIIWNQAEHSKFAKDLRLCAKKIQKEILAPYEDIKIKENGDVV